MIDPFGNGAVAQVKEILHGDQARPDIGKRQVVVREMKEIDVAEGWILPEFLQTVRRSIELDPPFNVK